MVIFTALMNIHYFRICNGGEMFLLYIVVRLYYRSCSTSILLFRWERLSSLEAVEIL